MKKFLSLMLCVVMLASLIVPARAAEAPRIIFTEESDYEPGFTVEVDTGATLMSCYNNGTSDTFFVPNDLVEPEFPEITTETLPRAVVGQEYYF